MSSTPHRATQCLAALLTLVSYSSAASADSWSGGEGVAPYPQGTDELRLISEEVVFKESRVTPAEAKKWSEQGTYWHITATYVLENTNKSERVKATLALPDAHCDTFEFCDTLGGGSNTFQDLELDVGGKERVSLSKTTLPKDNPWEIEEGDLYTHQITLKPGERITVTYRYKIDKSGAVDGEEYVTYWHLRETPWKGEVEQSRITLLLEERPWGVVFKKGLGFKSFETNKQGTKTTITFERRGAAKGMSASLTLGSDAVVKMAGCPIGVGHVQEFYDASGKMLQEDALRRNLGDLDEERLRKCRNVVYAAQGYTFKDKKLQDFFYQYAKPTPLDKIAPDFWGHMDRFNEEDRSSYEAIIFVPDTQYSTGRLKKRHTQWVKAIKVLEEELKKKKSK